MVISLRHLSALAQLLDDLLSPEAAAGIRRPDNGACMAGDECCQSGGSSAQQAHDASGCCRGEDRSGCACTGGEAASTASTGRVSSSASGIGPRGPGLPKDEYRRLKKAGLLPPKVHPAAEKCTTKDGKATTAGGQARPGVQHGRLGGMVVVYASQTGNAHNVAKDLYEDASEKGFAAELTDMAELDIEALVQRPPPLPVVVFISSTWTDGVPPPKAQGAFKRLFAPAFHSTSLARLRYAVFGLGNSVYGNNFCKAARDLDARLLALGAQRVCERGENDDDNYRPEVYAKWKDALWMAHGARVMGNSVQFFDRPPSDNESDDASGSAEEWQVM
jgi:flavodoxin